MQPEGGIEAVRLWQDDAASFQRAFRYQYAIALGHEAFPGFTPHSLNPGTLWCGAALPVCALQDSFGRAVGYVIGIAVAEAGLLRSDMRLPFDSTQADFFDRLETYIVDLAGRYALVVQVGQQNRLYCDPVGMIGVVYNAESKRVAASPLLTLDRPVIPHPLYDIARIEAGDGRYSLFHTADAKVRRLNPNCYLDLDSFTETRFWPRDEVFDCAPEDHMQIYSEIARRVSHVFGQITEHYDTALPLSGGHDSRLLAAMGQQHLGRIGTIFSHVNNFAGRRDAAIGAKIAKAFDVPHQIHDHHFAKPDPETTERVHRLNRQTSGSLVTPPIEYLNGNYLSLNDGAVVLRGHQTDLLRAVFVFRTNPKAWTRFGWQLARLGIAPMKVMTPEFRDRFVPDFAAWQATLPENAMARAVDFMFLEVYYASTVGASFPALWRNFYVSPFNSRRLIALSLGFNTTFRKNAYPVHDLTQILHPGLAEIPYDYEMPAGGREVFAALDDPTQYLGMTQVRRDTTAARIGQPLGQPQ